MKNKMLYLTRGVLFAMFIFIVLAPMGCSKEEDSQDDPTNPTPDPGVNNYLVNLKSWEEFCPQKTDEITEEDAVQGFDCEDQVVLTTTPCSITRTPEKIVTYDPGSEILYLGSLIQGEGYIGGLGSIQSLPIYQRAPITVSISFQMANNNRVVENPNLASVNQAIGELVEAAHNAGHISGSSIFFNKKTSHSVKQTALSLGLSYKFMKGGVEASLGFENTSERTTVSAYFKQKMFTTSMILPQVPGDIFSADFTQELLDEQVSLGRIGPDNLPVFVSNIVYGRMMVLTMTSDYEESEMKAALEASYNGIGGSISYENKEILENSEIQLVTIGGDASLALGYLRSGELGEFFKEDAPLTTAVPISYTLRNLGDNSVATVSETTEYDMVQYEPINLTLYDDEGDWGSAFQSGILNYKWECNLANVYDANENANFNYHSGTNQHYLYEKITFNEAAIGKPFSFSLENMDGNVTPYDELGLVFNENGNKNWGNYISIGDVDDFEDDDFEIKIMSGNVYAIAFIMENSDEYVGEYLKVYADDGSVDGCEIGYFAADDGYPMGDGFWGVVSPVPLRSIYFNEDDTGDDIAIGDLYFGYRVE